MQFLKLASVSAPLYRYPLYLSWLLLKIWWRGVFFASFGVHSRNRARPNVLPLQASQKSSAREPEATPPSYYHPALHCRESPPMQANPLCAQVSLTGEGTPLLTAKRAKTSVVGILSEQPPPPHIHQCRFNSFKSIFHRRLKRISPPQYRQSSFYYLYNLPTHYKKKVPQIQIL